MLGIELSFLVSPLLSELILFLVADLRNASCDVISSTKEAAGMSLEQSKQLSGTYFFYLTE